MNKFIKSNLKYPAEAKEKNVTGLVVIQFVINKTGQVSDPKVVKSLGAGTDEEAIKMVNKMPPFTPAKQNGKPVNFRYTLPIRFDIPSKETS
jgi:periplasmic protein TonB